MKFQFDLSVVEEITREGDRTGFWSRHCVCISMSERSAIRNREERSAGAPLRPSPRYHTSQALRFLIPAPNLICATLKAAGGSGSSPRRETFLSRPWLHLWPASATFPPPGGSEGLLPPDQPCSQALRLLWSRPGLREAAGGRLPLPCGGVLAVLTVLVAHASGFPWEGAWRRARPQDASR